AAKALVPHAHFDRSSAGDCAWVDRVDENVAGSDRGNHQENGDCPGQTPPKRPAMPPPSPPHEPDSIDPPDPGSRVCAIALTSERLAMRVASATRCPVPAQEGPLRLGRSRKRPRISSARKAPASTYTSICATSICP